MKNIIIFSVLLSVLSAMDFQLNNPDLGFQKNSVQSSRGTRDFKKTDYSKVFQYNLISTNIYRNYSLTHRGTRTSHNNSINSNFRLTEIKSLLKNRG